MKSYTCASCNSPTKQAPTLDPYQPTRILLPTCGVCIDDCENLQKFRSVVDCDEATIADVLGADERSRASAMLTAAIFEIKRRREIDPNDPKCRLAENMFVAAHEEMKKSVN